MAAAPTASEIKSFIYTYGLCHTNESGDQDGTPNEEVVNAFTWLAYWSPDPAFDINLSGISTINSSDTNRQQLVQEFFALLNTVRQHTDGIHVATSDIRSFFVEIPNKGICILIGILNAKAATAWNAQMYNFLLENSAIKATKKKDKPLEINRYRTDCPDSASTYYKMLQSLLIPEILSLMPDLSATSLGWDALLQYNSDFYSRSPGKRATLAKQKKKQTAANDEIEEAEDIETDGTYESIPTLNRDSLDAALEANPQLVLNFPIAMNHNFVLDLETMYAKYQDAVGFLCPGYTGPPAAMASGSSPPPRRRRRHNSNSSHSGTDDDAEKEEDGSDGAADDEEDDISIWKEDATTKRWTLQFKNLPPGICMFEVDLAYLAHPDRLFPSVLLPIQIVKQNLEPGFDISAYTPEQMQLYTLKEINGFRNPTRYKHISAPPTQIPEDLSMPYLDMLAKTITTIKSTHRMPITNAPATGELLREFIIDGMAKALVTMGAPGDHTPTGPRNIANTILNGLEDFGVGFIKKEDRPCKDAAHIMYFLQMMRDLQSIDFEVTLGIPIILQAIAGLISRQANFNIFICGIPGGGKSTFVLKIISLMIPNRWIVDSFSKMTFNCIETARKGRHSLMCHDEASTNKIESVTVAEFKNVLAGGSGGTRSTHDGFQLDKKASKTISTAPLGGAIFISNEPLDVIAKQLEHSNLDDRSGILDRFLRLTAPDNAMGMLKNLFAAEAIREAIARPGKYIMANAQYIALLVHYDVLPTPSYTMIEATFPRILHKYMEEHPNFKMIDRRMEDLRLIAMAATILEAVFEIVAMGKGLQGSIPSPKEICAFLYDAAIGLVVNEAAVVLACSIIFEGDHENKATPHTNAYPILDDLSNTCYTEGDPALNQPASFTIENNIFTDASVVLHSALSKQEQRALFEQTLTRHIVVAASKGTIDPITKIKSPDAPAIYAVKVLQLKTARNYIVHPKFFANAVKSCKLQFDITMGLFMQKCASLDPHDPNYIDVAPELPVGDDFIPGDWIDIPFWLIIEKLVKLNPDGSVRGLEEQKNAWGRSRNSVRNSILHRIHLDFYRLLQLNRDKTVVDGNLFNQFAEISHFSSSPNPSNSDLCFLRVSTAYYNTLVSTSPLSKVSTMIKKCIVTPGQYCTGRPAQDFRQPEIIVVHEDDIQRPKAHEFSVSIPNSTSHFVKGKYQSTPPAPIIYSQTGTHQLPPYDTEFLTRCIQQQYLFKMGATFSTATLTKKDMYDTFSIPTIRNTFNLSQDCVSLSTYCENPASRTKHSSDRPSQFAPFQFLVDLMIQTHSHSISQETITHARQRVGLPDHHAEEEEQHMDEDDTPLVAAAAAAAAVGGGALRASHDPRRAAPSVRKQPAHSSIRHKRNTDTAAAASESEDEISKAFYHNKRPHLAPQLAPISPSNDYDDDD